MAFTKKRIRVEVYLRAQKLEDGSDVIKIDGLPTSVTITKGGLPSMNEASITVSGLALDKMKALVMVGFTSSQFVRNRIKIYAGDTDPLPLVFVGDQTSGVVNMTDRGEAKVEIKAMTSVFAAQTPSKPVAVEGTSFASDLIAQFAKEAGFDFVNQGVTASVKNAVFRGDVMAKMRSVADQVDANLIVDDQTVILLPKNTPRAGDTSTLNAETGLIGYPVMTSRGISCRCLFMPYLKFLQSVRVSSIMPLATGTHRVIKITHNIDANNPDGGNWFTTFEAYFNYGF